MGHIPYTWIPLEYIIYPYEVYNRRIRQLLEDGSSIAKFQVHVLPKIIAGLINSNE